MNRSTPSRKKPMFVQQFISILLIFRSQLSQLPPYIYHSILLSFLALKYLRQGNTLASVLHYISTLLMIASDLAQIQALQNIGIGLAVINYIFVAPTLYTLPEFAPRVGLRENYAKMKNGKELYWAEWYPLAQGQRNQEYRIQWNHTIEHDKMAAYLRINNLLVRHLFKFFTSSVNRYKLTFAKGEPGTKRGTILFSHGRGATPFLYSSILRAMARDWQIMSPQHSQVNQTSFTDMNDIKKFRQIQVKHRAQQIVYLSGRLPENQPIVLMGHSYGGATVIQAYHLLPLSIRKRVTSIILLDPWLFPLSQSAFTDQIVCPVLMLSMPGLIAIKDVHTRNLQFIKRHRSRLLYICWKGGDHLHQTDMPFIIGTSLRQIHNAKQGWAMLQRNIQAIQMFLDFRKLDTEAQARFLDRFGEYDQGVDYMPREWDTRFRF